MLKVYNYFETSETNYNIILTAELNFSVAYPAENQPVKTYRDLNPLLPNTHNFIHLFNM